MEELIPAMEAALDRFSSGEVIQPVRQMLPVEEPCGGSGREMGLDEE